MQTKRIVFKNDKVVYYTIQNQRLSYYRGTRNKNKIVKRVRINKEKFFKDINRLKISK